MTVLIDIFAIIGMICVFSSAIFIIAILVSERHEKHTIKDHQMKTYTCAITDEPCMFSSEKASCVGCPIAEKEYEMLGRDKECQ